MLRPPARDRLITDNLPLVGFLAGEVQSRATHIAREDLVSAGALALVMAADAYDPDRGVPFGAYARRRILGAFSDEMRALDWASRGVRSRAKETLAVRDTLAAALCRVPTNEQIAATMGISESAVAQNLANAARVVMPLEDPAMYGLSSDIPLPDEVVAASERRDVLRKAIEALPEKMAYIVRAVYFEERPVKDIAEELGVGHSAISQQRSRALQRLREVMGQHYPDELLAKATVEVVNRTVVTTKKVVERGRSRARALSRQPVLV